jgi:hypothetical protein
MVGTMKSDIKKTIGLLALSVLTPVMITPNMVFGRGTQQGIPFAIQNVTQSVPVPGLEQYFQIGPILPPRQDGKFYSGELSYTTNLPIAPTRIPAVNIKRLAILQRRAAFSNIFAISIFV